eukprot:Rmarinus@m.20163
MPISWPKNHLHRLKLNAKWTGDEFRALAYEIAKRPCAFVALLLISFFTVGIPLTYLSSSLTHTEYPWLDRDQSVRIASFVGLSVSWVCCLLGGFIWTSVKVYSSRAEKYLTLPRSWKITVWFILAFGMTLYVYLVLGVLGMDIVIRRPNTDCLVTSGSCDGAFIWSGGVTSESAQLRFRVPNDLTMDPCSLVFINGINCLAFNTTEPFSTCTCGPTTEDHVYWVDLRSLEPSTTYEYFVDLSPTDVSALTYSGDPVHKGSFRTFDSYSPVDTLPRDSRSFRIAFGSCASTGAQGSVWKNIAAEKPDIFLHTGDLHYDNVKSSAAELYGEAYLRVLDAYGCCFRNEYHGTDQFDLYGKVPVQYVMDDHDFLGDGSDGSNHGAASAHREAYRAYVPHYDMPLIEGCTNPETGEFVDQPSTYQVIDVPNRVRVIITDMRNPRLDDGPNSRLFGECQLRRLFSDILREPAPRLVVWVAASPFLDGSSGGVWRKHDEWFGIAYDQEGNQYEVPGMKAQLVETLEAAYNRSIKVMMLSGDMHSLAYTKATTNPFGFPVFQAAPLAKPGFGVSCKGGPYDEADFCHQPVVFWGGLGRYGLMEIWDEGVRVWLKNYNGENVVTDTRLAFRKENDCHWCDAANSGANWGRVTVDVDAPDDYVESTEFRTWFKVWEAHPVMQAIVFCGMIFMLASLTCGLAWLSGFVERHMDLLMLRHLRHPHHFNHLQEVPKVSPPKSPVLDGSARNYLVQSPATSAFSPAGAKARTLSPALSPLPSALSLDQRAGQALDALGRRSMELVGLRDRTVSNTNSPAPQTRELSVVGSPSPFPMPSSPSVTPNSLHPSDPVLLRGSACCSDMSPRVAALAAARPRSYFGNRQPSPRIQTPPGCDIDLVLPRSIDCATDRPLRHDLPTVGKKPVLIRKSPDNNLPMEQASAVSAPCPGAPHILSIAAGVDPCRLACKDAAGSFHCAGETDLSRASSRCSEGPPLIGGAPLSSASPSIASTPVPPSPIDPGLLTATMLVRSPSPPVHSTGPEAPETTLPSSIGSDDDAASQRAGGSPSLSESIASSGEGRLHASSQHSAELGSGES